MAVLPDVDPCSGDVRSSIDPNHRLPRIGGKETMKTFDVSVPELGFVAVTRGIAGAGIGLLLADCFEHADTRRAIGWALLGIGALTTIPIAVTVMNRRADGSANGTAEEAR
ncbi:MAG TPA: hypothetical protein VFS06_18030 [Casimicrobiaceae bacterium]|jgi:hypothetical protein|nr:hypothetical protein [Casimicrobiaceae bacterium]